MTNFKLIVFDMDGVLVDACEWHRIALNEALKEICSYEISLEEHYSTFNGIPTRTKLSILNERKIVPKEKNNIIENLKQEKTISIIKNSAKHREEKIELMKFLKKKNIKVGCYTNSIRNTTELMLKKTGIFNYFDLVLTNEEVKEPKPSSEGYLLFFKKFDVTPKEVIIVEDSPKGLAAAEASGAKVIKVKNPDQVNKSLIEEFFE